MSSLPPPTLPSKQSFSSFQMPQGPGHQYNQQLRFPTHPDQSHYNQSSQSSNHHQISYQPEYFKVQGSLKQSGNSAAGRLNSFSEMANDMPQPMKPLNHQLYETYAGPNPSGYPTGPTSNQSQNNSVFNIQHVQQTQAEIPMSPAPSIWQKFPSYQDTNIKEHIVQVHDHSQHAFNGGTLTRQISEAQAAPPPPPAQMFGNEHSTYGTLPRPTATVKPLTNNNKSLYNSNDDASPVQAMELANNGDISGDEVCSNKDDAIQIDANLPFANERSGTIRMKTSPEQVFAEFEREERASSEATKEKAEGDSENRSLLKTPTRSSNRTAGDVMDDISSMLADLTDELDSMLCSESV